MADKSIKAVSKESLSRRAVFHASAGPGGHCGMGKNHESGVPSLQVRRFHIELLAIAIYCACPVVRSRSCVPLSR